jgi:hypothetical protein
MVEAGPVKMDIIDSQGRIVMQLFEGHRQAGEHEVVVNGTELTSGVYFARIVTDQGMRIRPFSMIK